jgi:hypothetical protein
MNCESYHKSEILATREHHIITKERTLSDLLPFVYLFFPCFIFPFFLPFFYFFRQSFSILYVSGLQPDLIVFHLWLEYSIFTWILGSTVRDRTVHKTVRYIFMQIIFRFILFPSFRSRVKLFPFLWHNFMLNFILETEEIALSQISVQAGFRVRRVLLYLLMYLKHYVCYYTNQLLTHVFDSLQSFQAMWLFPTLRIYSHIVTSQTFKIELIL